MPFYVNMQDKFMSGWGGAKGRKALCCVKCDTIEQAEAIAKAAHDRSEMRYIAISGRPRRANGNQRTIKTFADLSGSWLKYYVP